MGPGPAIQAAAQADWAPTKAPTGFQGGTVVGERARAARRPGELRQACT